ncbi:MFS transporter [Gemmatimonas groenlandica]|uniref:MFS transporter n=1 Tax=Gemmatimonas groenlandica TaxID=2732249 RepID=A0A6M4IP76_9BACT|nr:MFS transporter [Gemmatimonas groenlandica]QJR34051.1 MFS transporter [Gemmatimonas groenlandica]
MTSVALRPFGSPAFRVLWVATVVSTTGTWIHDVGATWLMTGLTPSPIMVSLVQTATTMPVLALALPAGVLADVLDRRRVLIAAQLWMTIAALVLGLLTLSGRTTPATLLVMTFVLGIGAALTAPAWQAIVPELVATVDVPAAITLNSAGVNVARAIGPAVGGLLIAANGPAPAFLINAVTFMGVTAALVWWRRSVPPSVLPPEPLVAALGVGLRYVRNTPPLITVLVRTLAFIAFGSALWALLPLVARVRLGASVAGYGLLLGAIGIGALSATVLLPVLRRRYSIERLVVVATLAYAVVLLVLATSNSYFVVFVTLLLAGSAWLTLLSTLQTSAQATVPSWVRGRALAVYLMVFFGGQAGGSIVWGAVAELLGSSASLVIAACGLVLGLTTARRYPLHTAGHSDQSPSHHWPMPESSPGGAPERGTRVVVVMTEYLIDPGSSVAFSAAMREMRAARMRSGAVRWQLANDLSRPERFVEQFTVPTWDEHLRQHARVSIADEDVQRKVRAFHRGVDPPAVTHLIAVY